MNKKVNQKKSASKKKSASRRLNESIEKGGFNPERFEAKPNPPKAPPPPKTGKDSE